MAETAPASLTPKLYEEITSLSSSAKLNRPDGANRCIVQCLTQNCRYRADGTPPTSAIGVTFKKDTQIPLHGKALIDAIRFIEETASSKLSVQYFDA